MHRIHKPNALLAEHIARYGWSQSEVADRINAAYEIVEGRPGRYTPESIRRLVSGAVSMPQRPYRRAIEAVFDATLAELGFANRRISAEAPSTSSAPLPADHSLSEQWTCAGTLRAIGAIAESDHMERRTFLTLTSAAITAPAHQWLVTPPNADVARAAGTRIGMNTVVEIDGMTAGLRRMDDQAGGVRLLEMVRALLRHVLHLLRHGSYSDTVGRCLHTCAAELLRLAGWLSFDNGRHAHAQRYWITGLRTAKTAGDNALAANILGFMSCQVKDIGRPRDAALLAETALAGYPGSSPRVHAILKLRAAEAHAAEGSVSETRRALDSAFTALDTPAEDAPDWAYWLDATHAHGQAGYCYLRLGQHENATRHLHTALGGADNDSREGALRYVLLATTYLRQPKPDLDRGLEFADRAVDLLTEKIDSSRVAGHLGALRGDLTSHRRHPGVHTLLDRVREMENMGVHSRSGSV